MCHPNPHHPTAALALGPRWIAFATGQPVPTSPLSRPSPRSPAPPIGQKIATVAKDVAWDLAAGLYKMGDRGLQAVQSYLHPDAAALSGGSASGSVAGVQGGDLNGVGVSVAVGAVMIKDVTNQNVVAHFQAHGIPITSMTFNPSGSLVRESVEI